MIINFETHKDGVWFPFFYSHIDPSTLEVTYDDPIENGPRMKIRDPAPFFRERSDKRKTKSEFVLNKATRAMNLVTSEVELTAEQKRAESDDFADYVICDLENFKLEGRIVECTREDKIKIMDFSLAAMFVHRCIAIMQESGAQEEEAERKNLSTGSSSQTTKPDPE